MLAARRIPQILQDHLSDGIDGMCLMTKEGSLLSSALSQHAAIDEIALAAVSSSIWGNYSEGNLYIINFYLNNIISNFLFFLLRCF